jgi:uncharacterized protein
MTTQHAPAPDRERFGRGIELLLLALLALAALSRFSGFSVASPAFETWGTFFVSLVTQALPFLVMGVVISGAVAAYLSPRLVARALPDNPVLAVTGATGAGLLLPGCECGSVPISGRLVSRGVPPGAALAFMLSAPAINPVVLLSTAVAFPGQPRVVAARFVASVVTALVVGLLWLRFGDTDALVERAQSRIRDSGTALGTLVATVRHDFLHAGGYLVLGAGVAAALQVLVPRSVVETVASSGVAAVIAMATLAVVLSICSEADAFVAASLTQFSLTSRLVFMVVGPAVDLKLVALQAGIFGRGFALRFAPLALVVATGAVVLVGGWLL